MKALSIHSFYASAIACGLKAVELRSWRTSHKGDLLICSTKRDQFTKGLKERFVFGKALAVAELLGCIPYEESHRDAAFVDEEDEISEGTYSWVLDNIRPIKPFDVKGRLSLFDVDTAGVEYLGIAPTTEDGSEEIQDYWINHGYITTKPWG